MWPFTSTNDYLIKQILAKNIIDNLEAELSCKEMSKERKERKKIILQSVKYYYSL